MEEQKMTPDYERGEREGRRWWALHHERRETWQIVGSADYVRGWIMGETLARGAEQERELGEQEKSDV